MQSPSGFDDEPRDPPAQGPAPRRETTPTRPPVAERPHPARRVHWRDGIAFGVLLVLALACFARLAAEPGALIVDGNHPSVDNAQAGGLRRLGNDVTYLFLLNFLHVSQQLPALGHPPLWDSSGFCGRPAVGNPQSGLFYMPLWLAWATRAPSALCWLTVAHLVWAGLGTYVLTRSLGLTRPSATIAAGCFQAAPYLLAHVFEGHYPHIWAVAWYPWAFYAFWQHRAGHRLGTVLVPLTLAMAFFTGHLQEWYYLTFALSVWTTADAAQMLWRRQWREAILILTRWAAVAGLSFGIVAIELLPEMAAQVWTLRSGGVSHGLLSKYNPHSVNVFQLLSPLALGGPADYFGHTNYWESLLSVGLVPLILGLIAVARYSNRAVLNAWLALTVATTVYAGGPRLGLCWILSKTVPGMDRFRVPSRALFLASLGAAVLAGLGVETLAQLAASANDWRAVERRFRQVAAAVFAGLFIAAFLSWSVDDFEASRPTAVSGAAQLLHARSRVFKAGRNPIRPEDIFEEVSDEEPYRGRLASYQILSNGVFWLAIGGSAVLLGYGALRTANRRAAAWALGALALCELGLYGFSILKVAPASQFVGGDPMSAAIAEGSAHMPRPFRIHSREDTYEDLRAKANGFEKVKNNDWFEIHFASELYQELYPLLDRDAPPPLSDRMGITLRQSGRDIRQCVLDRMGAAFLVSDHLEPGMPWQLLRSGAWNGKPFAVYRNPSAMPRAYVVPRAYPTREYTPRELALFRLVDPRTAVLMELDPLRDRAPRQPYTPAEWVATNDPDRVVVRVATSAPGLLVVGETWMPGWTATLDGRPVPILRGNHAQRVIALTEPGAHEVEMRYWPDGLTRGAAISALAAVAWFGLVLITRPARARPAATTVESATYVHVHYPAPHFRLESSPAG
jgi:hypothetical protein